MDDSSKSLKTKYEELASRLKKDKEAAYQKRLIQVEKKKQQAKDCKEKKQCMPTKVISIKHGSGTKLRRRPDLKNLANTKTNACLPQNTTSENNNSKETDDAEVVINQEKIVIKVATVTTTKVKEAVKPPKNKSIEPTTAAVIKTKSTDVVGKQVNKAKERKNKVKTKNKKGVTKCVEAKRKYEREKKRRQRAKMTTDDLLIKRAKDREYYKKKKEEGKVKTINDMTAREQRMRRKNWQQYAKVYRQKKATRARTEEFVRHNTPPLSPQENEEPHAVNVDSRKLTGRKKVKRHRSQTYRQLIAAKAQLRTLEARVQRYKKRLQRAAAKTRGSPSPRKRVEQMTKGRKVGAVIKRELLFGQVVKAQLKQRMESLKNIEQVRRAIGVLFSGKYSAKYRIIGQTKELISYKMHKKYQLARSVHVDRKKYSSLAARTATNVREFLEEDIHSRMCPGKKETKTSNKIKRQKRLLLDTLKNLHSKYNATHATKLSYSTFVRLKPYWVLQPKMADRETCACKTHANIQFMVAKLFQVEVLKIKEANELCSLVCCNKRQKDCMYRTCKICKNVLLQPDLTDDKKAENVKYYQWQVNKEVRNIKGQVKEVKLTEKVLYECTVQELVTKINSVLPAFLTHSYNIGHQYYEMKSLKEDLKENEVQIHIDFSENYVLKLSEEVQSMHFGASQRQVALHTGVMYCITSNENPDLKIKSFCTVSSNLDHGAHAVWAHLEPILELVKTDCPLVDTLHFLSDGPSAQYKNRYNLFLLMNFLPKLFPNVKSVTWNYSESSHGKGAMDGVGGVLKRTADNLVKLGTDISSVSEFVSKLTVACPGVTIIEVEGSNIERVKQQVPANVQKIPRIMKLHQAAWSLEHPHTLQLRQLSCGKCRSQEVCHHHPLGKGFITFKHHTKLAVAKTAKNKKPTEVDGCTSRDSSPSSEQHITIGTYVAVIYDDVWYPGLVEEVNAGQLKICFMKRTGKNLFQWPRRRDVQLMQTSGILCIIPKAPVALPDKLYEIENASEIDLLAIHAD